MIWPIFLAGALCGLLGMALGRKLARGELLEATKALADTATELHESLEASSKLLGVRCAEIARLEKENAELRRVDADRSAFLEPIFRIRGARRAGS